jgi:hypothetical protein
MHRSRAVWSPASGRHRSGRTGNPHYRLDSDKPLSIGSPSATKHTLGCSSPGGSRSSPLLPNRRHDTLRIMRYNTNREMFENLPEAMLAQPQESSGGAGTPVRNSIRARAQTRRNLGAQIPFGGVQLPLFVNPESAESSGLASEIPLPGDEGSDEHLPLVSENMIVQHEKQVDEYAKVRAEILEYLMVWAEKRNEYRGANLQKEFEEFLPRAVFQELKLGDAATREMEGQALMTFATLKVALERCSTGTEFHVFADQLEGIETSMTNLLRIAAVRSEVIEHAELSKHAKLNAAVTAYSEATTERLGRTDGHEYLTVMGLGQIDPHFVMRVTLLVSRMMELFTGNATEYQFAESINAGIKQLALTAQNEFSRVMDNLRKAKWVRAVEHMPESAEKEVVEKGLVDDNYKLGYNKMAKGKVSTEREYFDRDAAHLHTVVVHWANTYGAVFASSADGSLKKIVGAGQLAGTFLVQIPNTTDVWVIFAKKSVPFAPILIHLENEMEVTQLVNCHKIVLEEVLEARPTLRELRNLWSITENEETGVPDAIRSVDTSRAPVKVVPASNEDTAEATRQALIAAGLNDAHLASMANVASSPVRGGGVRKNRSTRILRSVQRIFTPHRKRASRMAQTQSTTALTPEAKSTPELPTSATAPALVFDNDTSKPKSGKTGKSGKSKTRATAKSESRGVRRSRRIAANKAASGPPKRVLTPRSQNTNTPLARLVAKRIPHSPGCATMNLPVDSPMAGGSPLVVVPSPGLVDTHDIDSPSMALRWHLADDVSTMELPNSPIPVASRVPHTPTRVECDLP